MPVYSLQPTSTHSTQAMYELAPPVQRGDKGACGALPPARIAQ